MSSLNENISEEIYNINEKIEISNREDINNILGVTNNNILDNNILDDTEMLEELKKTNLENVQSLLQDYDYSSKTDNMVKIIGNLLNYAKLPNDLEYKKIVVKIMYEVLHSYLDILKSNKNLSQFVLTMKYKFHEMIIDEKMIELVPIYNKMFNDNLYDRIVFNTPQEIVDEVDFKALVDEYNEKKTEYLLRKKYSRIGHPFEEGEIVGAKNREGDWWMSRIIKIFNYLQHNIFYVEFLGWGEEFNEFIPDVCKIKKFNPIKHKYYRTAWKKK